MRLFPIRTVLSVLFAAAPFHATTAGADEGRQTGPVVVELFTSQSCYSCPPAEAFLAELAKDDSVIALEWHVDYWDRLVYGAAGSWKDPFSSYEHTRRQRAYNAAISGEPRAYTPQMVVGGTAEAVGSKERDVRRLIAAAPASPATVACEPGADGHLSASISGDAAGDVWLVRFQRSAVTRVTHGENHGKTLANANVVKEFARLGAYDGGEIAFDVAPPADSDGAAVLVQAGEHGPMIGGAYCKAANVS